jgi:DnaJ-class molecular chaperone
MFLDYYQILSITSNSDATTIKRAYRSQASIWHPNVNKSEDALEKMKLINEAYIILKDAEARAKYDVEYHKFFKKMKSNSVSNDVLNDYKVEDEILEKWMENAKAKAAKIVMESLTDVLGATNAGLANIKEEFFTVSKYRILLIILSFMLLFYLIISRNY